MNEAWAIGLGVLALGGYGAVAKWVAAKVSKHGESIAVLRTEVRSLGGQVERLDRKLDRFLSRP